jgi:hypothetical protein
LGELDGSSTEQAEQARASAYGVPFGIPPADVDADGDTDSADVTQITTWSNAVTYEVRGDLSLDDWFNVHQCEDVMAVAAATQTSHSLSDVLTLERAELSTA